LNQLTDSQKEAYNDLKKSDPHAAESMMINILNGRIKSINQAMQVNNK
jgi:hypothetical protein